MLRTVVVVLVAALISSSVRADPTAARDVNAEQLFRRGRQLMKEKQYEQACVAFQKSQEVSPNP
jgi:outer membrane protein assembly factor BamD (BamD/ComL family)